MTTIQHMLFYFSSSFLPLWRIQSWFSSQNITAGQNGDDPNFAQTSCPKWGKPDVAKSKKEFVPTIAILL